jgi:hypothetical protein
MALGSPMALSVSSSDWGSPTPQQRRNTQWEVWAENSKDHQVNNPMNNSRDDTSSSDSNEHSSGPKYDDRWESWELGDPDSHPEKDESHNPFRNSRPGTPSPDSNEHSTENKYDERWDKWELEDPDGYPERDESHNPLRSSNPSTPPPDLSLLSLEQKNNHHWRRCTMESSDMGSQLSHLTGDEDYIPPQNSRPTPGSSSNGSISRENSTKLQNKNTQRIGMSPYNFFSDFLPISLNPAPHLLNPKNWASAYAEVDTLKPGEVVSLAVLDFFLSLESHQSQLSTDFRKRFYYLSQDVISNLTGELEDKKWLFQKFLTIIDENTLSCPFLFLVTPQTATPTYFLVMFDFREENALILGHHGLSGPDFHKTYGEWESWKGRALWQNIYSALIRPGFEQREKEPTVYKTDLIPVRNLPH